LGVHIIGAAASDMIAEATLAIHLEATVDDLVDTIHAHPTWPEGLAEAAMAVNGLALHLLKPRERRAGSDQPSAVSRQRAAVSRQSGGRVAWQRRTAADLATRRNGAAGC